MNTNTHPGTAKIYQFPVHPRTAVTSQRGSADAAELMAQHISSAIETCWYHDAAIQQSTGSIKP